MPEYPERAVLEGIVNALIHRNYLEIGSEVHIDMFDDRIEIYSPGGMLDGTRVQDRDLMNVPSRRRNPVIADIFSRLKYMDRRGSGFKKIIGDYRQQPQYEEDMKPEFNSDYDQFLLILKNLNYKLDFQGSDEVTTMKVFEKMMEKTTKKKNQNTANEIVEIMIKNPKITAKEIAGMIGITADGVRYHIKKLKVSGRIERVGSDRVGRWKVNY